MGFPTFKELIIYLRVVKNELANNGNTVTGPEKLLNKCVNCSVSPDFKGLESKGGQVKLR